MDYDRSTVAPLKQAAWMGDAERVLPVSIGHYRILHLLGEGGMGIVYEAEQENPRRTVALKVIKAGFVTNELRRRFQQEASALGRLQHPGIAQIHEAGAADAGPWFAMELVRGRPLREYADAEHLNTGQRLELMLKICEAVDHAHQRGIIHRDLKPGNILVEESGQPKVLDFGVARATDGDGPATRQTDLGQVMGTLAYMSPEQALGDPRELDVRSDVYSLGVICYELLAGRLPYQASGKLHEAIEAIRETDPARLSLVNRIYRGDIETIVAKALEKDKARRYSSAAEFAADIRRYLSDEPILARPASTAYQLRKFARRNKALVTGLAAAFALLAGGIVATTWQAGRATRERDRAAAAEHTATTQRDRALTAEKTASAAGAQAVEERNRALTEKQRADTEAATAKAVNDFLQNDLLAQASATAQAGPNSTPDPNLKVRTALDRAAARIAGKFDAQPLVEASLRQTIGATYLDLGLYVEAEREIERAVDLRRRVLGAENSDTLQSLNTLANTLLAQGKYPASEDLYARVLAVQQRVLGEDHRDTLATMSGLVRVYREETRYATAAPLAAKVLKLQRSKLGEENPETLRAMLSLAAVTRDLGKYPEAEELFQKVLAIQRRTLGEEHPETIATLSQLALQYREEGKFAASEAAFARSLELRTRVLGQEHPDTLESMNGLAIVYRVNGKYAQAEELFTRALEIERKTLGEEHPLTVTSMGELPGVYWVEGKYAQAEPLYLKVLELRRRVLGPENDDTVSTMNNLATLYMSEGKFAEAEPLLTTVLEIRRHTIGENNARTLISMNNLAVEYRHLGKYSQAETLFAKVLEARRHELGEESPDTLKTLDALAALYRIEGRYEESESLYTKVVEARRRVLGEKHPDSLVSLNGMALLYLEQRRYSEAEALFENVLNARRGVLGQNHPDTIGVMDSLGRLRLKQQRYAEAEAILRQGLAGKEKMSSDAWDRFDTQAMLGASLAGQRRYADAEPLLLAGYEGLLKRESTIPSPNRSVVLDAGESVVELYRDWGRPEKAAEWRGKLRTLNAAGGR